MAHDHAHHHCIETALTDAEAYCHAHNLRFTDIRREVFSIIWRSHKALTAAEVMTLLGNDQPPVTYRALEFLTANNLIHHVASLNAYVGCTHVGEDHTSQLLICKDCRNVTELAAPLPAVTAAAKHEGFHIDQAQLEVLGHCRNCQSHTS